MDTVTMEGYDEDGRYETQDRPGTRNGARVTRYSWHEIERQLRAFEAREKEHRRWLAVLGIVAALSVAWAGLLLGRR